MCLCVSGVLVIVVTGDVLALRRQLKCARGELCFRMMLCTVCDVHVQYVLL